MKILYKYLTVFSLILLIAGCSREPVKVGFISGLSGGNSDLGEAGRNGAMMAVEEINETGGIDGQGVSLLIRDDGNDTEKAAAAAQELADEKVIMIVGPFSTVMAEAVHQVTEEAEILTITPTASAMQLTGRDDYLFKLNSSTRDNAGAYAEFMYGRLNQKRITIAADQVNRAFSESWVIEFKHQFKALGGEVLGASYFDSTSLQAYKPLVDKLLTGNPDSILIVCSSVDTARLAQQIRKADSEIPLITSEWAGTQQLIELGGTAAEGMTVLQNVNFFGKEAAFLEFVENYRLRFRSEPSFSSIMAYESIMVGLNAYSLKSKKESLKDAVIANSPYQGLQQVIKFNHFGDSARDPVFVEIRNREFKLLEQP